MEFTQSLQSGVKMSKYTRTTHDEWQILVNYGQGWEHEVTEFTWKEAREQKKCYNLNCDYPVKIKKVRVKNS